MDFSLASLEEAFIVDRYTRSMISGKITPAKALAGYYKHMPTLVVDHYANTLKSIGFLTWLFMAKGENYVRRIPELVTSIDPDKLTVMTLKMLVALNQEGLIPQEALPKERVNVPLRSGLLNQEDIVELEGLNIDISQFRRPRGEVINWTLEYQGRFMKSGPGRTQPYKPSFTVPPAKIVKGFSFEVHDRLRHLFTYRWVGKIGHREVSRDLDHWDIENISTNIWDEETIRQIFTTSRTEFARALRMRIISPIGIPEDVLRAIWG